MPIPRILLCVPLLALGLFLPALGSDPVTPPAGAVGMAHEVFTTETLTVHQGGTVTLVNNSLWMHTIGPGRDGRLEDNAAVPLTGRRLMQTNDTETTGRWNTPGTYYLTCSVHPEMTVKVIVTKCGCCANGSCK
jgi:plastocyanin